MPEFTLENPWYLLAAIPAAGLLVWVLRRTSTPLPTLRRVIGGVGMVGACIALLLAAAGLFYEVSSDQRTVWVLVDRSLSAGTSAENRLPTVLESLRNSLPPDDYVGVITFDENATVVLKPTPVNELRDDLELPEWKPSDETYVSTALELANQQSIPGTSPFAILLGDGYDSSSRYGGDVMREARDSGVRLFALPVDSRPLPETAVADFGVRLIGDEQRVLAVDVVIFSTIEQLVVPQLKVNGKPPGRLECDKLDSRGRMRVGVGRNPVRMLVYPDEILPSYVVEVSVGAEGNTFSKNDSLKLSVRGPGASQIMMIHGTSGREDALERAITRAGMKVISGGPGILPSEMVELSRYQILVIADVPATDFTSSQMDMIERFVRNGGGLAMIGGPDTYAPGGYYKTAVERVLPVTCDVTEKGRKQVPALVVTLDRSGSMSAQAGKYTKMELANEGCVRTINLVPPGSYFGMLSVDTGPDWVVPLERLEKTDVARQRARANLPGGGGIDVDVALAQGIGALRATDASTKHLVLFADGDDVDKQTSTIDGMTPQEYVAQAFERDQITVTTISLERPGTTGAHSGFLEQLSRHGRGRYFAVQDASDLPAVFSREAALSTGNFIREEAFRPWHGLPGSLTADIDFEQESTPELLGYVAATAREESHVWLWADEDKERPLLATWNIELGKSLAWTSDARDRWSDNWLGWERYDELWQRWMKWLLPEPERIHGVESEWSINRAGPTLTMSFFDEAGNPRELADPVADIELADGSTTKAVVLPVGSGSYRVQFPRSGSGVYSARVRERPVGGEERLVAREHRILVPLEELMQRNADEAALKAVSEASGGKLISAPNEILDVETTDGRRTVYPYGELLWVAVVGLFLAIGARRFPSIWRRRQEDRRRRVKEEERALTARAAMDRVRKQLEERNRPRRQVAARSDRYEPPLAPPPPPPAVAPKPAAPKPPPAKSDASADGGSLLSAMRKVRKEIDKRNQDQ